MFWKIMTPILATLLVMAAYSIDSDKKKTDNEKVIATQKWNEWVSYRDKNCHVSEKLYGLSMTSGKFHQDDNATVYECNDGVKYVVAQSIESAAVSHSLQTWQVPVAEKNENK